MRRYALYLMIAGWAVGWLWPIAAQEEPSDTKENEMPSFQEMSQFCKKSLVEIDKASQPDKKPDPKHPKNNQQPNAEKIELYQKIYMEERQDLEKLAEDAKKKYLEKELKEGFKELEYTMYLIRLSLFEKARQCLQTLESRLAGKEGLPTYVYYAHLAWTQRCLGKSEEAELAAKLADKAYEHAKKRGKLGKWAQEKLNDVKRHYDNKSLQWLRLHPKLDYYKDQIRQHPETAELWKRLAEYSNALEFRVDEIAALRMLYENFPPDSEQLARLIEAYKATEQWDKAKNIKKK